MSCLRLSIWSGPRNVSTALMYSFRQRSDTRVFDEPLYGYYLRHSGARHPGRNEVLAAMDRDGERVVRDILLGPCERPVLFFKNMAHHLRGLDWDFLDDLRSVLLTRDPAEMLPSLAGHITDPSLADTGLPEQVQLLERELDRGRSPIVLEAKEILRDPRSVLTEACRRLGIPFAETMLTWPAGPKPEDGVWARYWYASAHRSTGFAPYRPKEAPFPDELLPLLEEARPLYARLAEHAIRAP